MGFTIGKQQSDETNAKTALTNTASNIAAIDGNIIINAGGTYQQTGSNIIAGMGNDSSLDINDANRGNTVVRAKEINIDNALDIYTNQSEQKFKQSGLTVSVSNSLVDSVKSIDSLVDAGGNTDSTRMKGMAALAGALKAKALAKQTSDALQGASGFGSTRIQATIGSQKSQSNSSSYTEVNQASNIITNNLALMATGGANDPITGSNININGSNLEVANNALFQADNDFNVNGVAQKSNTRSNNKSSNTAIGGYADTSGSAGITASASKAKGYANSDSITYANSHINVGGTTTFDIGNNVNIKGGVLNTEKIQGNVKGDMTIESLQDMATYDSKQKNMGFSADIDLAKGTGSSLSVNGGKTNLSSDYKGVGEQSGIFANEADLITQGKGTFKGGVFVTSKAAQDNGNSNIVFKQGVTSTDLKNTTSYEGDAIQAGISIGSTNNKPQASMNGIGYGTDSDSDSSITKGGVSGYNDPEGILTTENREALGGKLESVFDASRVTEELGAQTEITQAFDQERRKVKTDINAKEKALRDEANAARDVGDYETAIDKTLAANEVQNQGLLFDAISGAIYGSNSNGVTGYVAKAASPFVATQIGDYFKTNRVHNKEDGGNRLETNSPAHILAQGILGAAVSYATGNDALTGGISAGAGEATAPLISDYLFDTKNPDELTAEQKDTLSSITSALGLGIGATTVSASDAANAAETSKVAVEDNHMGGDRNKTNKQLAEDTRKMNKRAGMVFQGGKWVYKSFSDATKHTLSQTTPQKLSNALDDQLGSMSYKGRQLSTESKKAVLEGLMTSAFLYPHVFGFEPDFVMTSGGAAGATQGVSGSSAVSLHNGQGYSSGNYDIGINIDKSKVRSFSVDGSVVYGFVLDEPTAGESNRTVLTANTLAGSSFTGSSCYMGACGAIVTTRANPAEGVPSRRVLMLGLGQTLGKGGITGGSMSGGVMKETDYNSVKNINEIKEQVAKIKPYR